MRRPGPPPVDVQRDDGDVWLSELDLMARLEGFRLAHRWAGWDRSAFTSDGGSHVSVYVKTG